VLNGLYSATTRTEAVMNRLLVSTFVLASLVSVAPRSWADCPQLTATLNNQFYLYYILDLEDLDTAQGTAAPTFVVNGTFQAKASKNVTAPTLFSGTVTATGRQLFSAPGVAVFPCEDPAGCYHIQVIAETWVLDAPYTQCAMRFFAPPLPPGPTPIYGVERTTLRTMPVAASETTLLSGPLAICDNGLPCNRAYGTLDGVFGGGALWNAADFLANRSFHCHPRQTDRFAPFGTLGQEDFVARDTGAAISQRYDGWRTVCPADTTIPCPE
jgi:hypothetical protein